MFDSIISVEKFVQSRQENWVIIDCRFSLADEDYGRQAYQKSHISGAFYAHLNEDLSGKIIPGVTGRHPLPSVQKIADLFSEWGIEANTQVVAYDQKFGGFAARLWWMLKWLGHEKVAVLEGGFEAWENAKLPVNADIPVKKDSNFFPVENKEWVLSALEVEMIRKNEAYKLVDSREKERYDGIKEPIDPVAGHIDGAINLPFGENLLESGHFKDPEQLRLRFEAAVRDISADHTIFYCGSGVTACHNILAYYYAGLGFAKLYPGSWSEWITTEFY